MEEAGLRRQQTIKAGQGPPLKVSERRKNYSLSAPMKEQWTTQKGSEEMRLPVTCTRIQKERLSKYLPNDINGNVLSLLLNRSLENSPFR